VSLAEETEAGSTGYRERLLTLVGDHGGDTARAFAAAYVRRLLSIRMNLRRSPEVHFLFDQSVAAQDRVEEILLELKREEEARAAEAAPADAVDATAVAAETPAADTASASTLPADDEPSDPGKTPLV